MAPPSRPRTVSAQAPTRVDLAGGTLDLWPLYLLWPGSRTLNAAIDLHSTARLEIAPAGYEIVSTDQGRSVRGASLADLEAQDGLPLLVHLTRHFAPAPGLRIVTENRSPAGAGLGGSSSLAVALAAALAEWTGQKLEPEPLIALVGNLEAQVLRAPTGIQDYYAAVYGGVSLLSLGPLGVRREGLDGAGEWLEPNLVLCYTGAPHQSGLHNWDVYKRAVDREAVTCEALAEIAAAAGRMEAALRAQSLGAVAEALGEEWEARRRLAPGVSTARIEEVVAWARSAGARAAKVCGAGGGGCVLLLAEVGRAAALAEALRVRGVEVVPFRLAMEGLSVRRGRAAKPVRAASGR